MSGTWEEFAPDSELVRRCWRASVHEAASYPVAASEFWGISFARHRDGSLSATVDGPSLRMKEVDSVVGESYWGVELAAHVFLRGTGKSALTGETVSLLVAGEQVRIGHRLFPIPEWEHGVSFCEELVAAGVLIADDEVRRALTGDAVGLSRRSWQRHFRQATGLTRAQVAQLERARRAYLMLTGGMTCSEAANAAGYADQAHLTRALRVISGQTPARILAGYRPVT